MRRAQQGLEELRRHVDTHCSSNQNLFKIANEETTFESFLNFQMMFCCIEQSITDLMVRPGLINLLADVESVMSAMAKP